MSLRSFANARPGRPGWGSEQRQRRARDGWHCIANALDFIARLAALVPRTRTHLVRYHGIFAPNACHRAYVLAKRQIRAQQSDDAPPQRVSRVAKTWMQRLRRVFDIDVSLCPRCGGALRVLAVIAEPAVIKAILAHLQQRPAGARAPPAPP